MNIWFRHSHEHSPVCRPPSDLSSTLDQYDFSDDEDMEGVGDEMMDEQPRENRPDRNLL